MKKSLIFHYPHYTRPFFSTFIILSDILITKQQFAIKTLLKELYFNNMTQLLFILMIFSSIHGDENLNNDSNECPAESTSSVFSYHNSSYAPSWCMKNFKNIVPYVFEKIINFTTNNSSIFGYITKSPYIGNTKKFDKHVLSYSLNESLESLKKAKTKKTLFIPQQEKNFDDFFIDKNVIMVHGTSEVELSDFYNNFFLEISGNDDYIKNRVEELQPSHTLIELKNKRYKNFLWSGVLSHYARNNASKALFNHINNSKKYVLIGHSHGGTVILNMAHFFSKENNPVDIIVLIGTPISEKNKENAHIFSQNGTKIYNIFSYGDIQQISDPTLVITTDLPQHIIETDATTPSIFNIHLGLQLKNQKNIYAPDHLEYPGFFSGKNGKLGLFQLFIDFLRPGKLIDRSRYETNQEGICDILTIVQEVDQLIQFDQLHQNDKVLHVIYRYKK